MGHLFEGFTGFVGGTERRKARSKLRLQGRCRRVVVLRVALEQLAEDGAQRLGDWIFVELTSDGAW
ncbi:hypothetical protein DB31_3735 [Hyalangium minutum]|uniref:Uncharacterized protein n=1 Tax=Hyalangium minutum TaxID=394096 RepID=A0A085W4K8_9BACT|nr:hypothetical protein DB31_3735 [Hyalangium minutum]